MPTSEYVGMTTGRVHPVLNNTDDHLWSVQTRHRLLKKYIQAFSSEGESGAANLGAFHFRQQVQGDVDIFIEFTGQGCNLVNRVKAAFLQDSV